MKLLKKVFLTDRFFIVLGIVIAIYVFSYVFPLLFIVAHLSGLVFIAFFMTDFIILFKSKNNGIKISRKLPRMFSLGDHNAVTITIKCDISLTFSAFLIDEIPIQLQKRDFGRAFILKPGAVEKLRYTIVPKTRGEYVFRNINLFLKSPLKLLSRKDIYQLEHMVPVYPSIIQMEKYSLRALSKISVFHGVKKLRRIGHSYEFDHIKNYVPGDDPRTINWKASGRSNNIMVNHYEDERSQQVYCIIDKSRVMKMPFHGLSLLDYAINTSLVISKVAIQKQDKAGLFTFSDKIGTLLKADSSNHQLQKILEALYKEKEHHLESNYELLYSAVRNMIKHRSLLFLFTNFESSFAVERVMPLLRRINAFHLLVVIFFENTELSAFVKKECKRTLDIYHQTLGRKYISEKTKILKELDKYGIQSIISKPEELSIDTINKYLELKAKGLI